MFISQLEPKKNSLCISSILEAPHSRGEIWKRKIREDCSQATLLKIRKAKDQTCNLLCIKQVFRGSL